MDVLNFNSMINHCIRRKTFLSRDGLTFGKPRLPNNYFNNDINILTNVRFFLWLF